MSGDLFEEHQAIVEAAEEFVTALKLEPRIPLDQLSRLRVKLSTLVRRHRTTEEEFIFGPLTREGGLGKLPHLEPFVQELMREKVRYSEHVRKWTPRAIEEDWAGYVRACEGLLEGLRRIVRDDQASIYQVVRSLSPTLLQNRSLRS
ncbi:MAG: hypothetical protein J7494_11115 [Sphingobium sp.]|nr:hypothetical protein [Sphingobium sp.]